MNLAWNLTRRMPYVWFHCQLQVCSWSNWCSHWNGTQCIFNPTDTPHWNTIMSGWKSSKHIVLVVLCMYHGIIFSQAGQALAILSVNKMWVTASLIKGELLVWPPVQRYWTRGYSGNCSVRHLGYYLCSISTSTHKNSHPVLVSNSHFNQQTALPFQPGFQVQNILDTAIYVWAVAVYFSLPCSYVLHPTHLLVS